jgi:acetylornithine/N-succinyldiaminopimelate aminotransferase
MIAIKFYQYTNKSIASYINDKLLEKRIILVKRPGYEVLRIDPSLTIEWENIDLFLNIFEEILEGIVDVK